MNFAHTHSILLYGSIFLCAEKDSIIKPLYSLQNKAIRTITNSHRRTSAGPLYIQLDILPLKQLITYSICSFMFDYTCGNLPEGFTDCWRRNRDHRDPRVNDRPLRNNDDFYVPFLRYVYLTSHPLYYFSNVWNSLSDDIKNSFPKKAFQRKLKSSLMLEIAI